MTLTPQASWMASVLSALFHSDLRMFESGDLQEHRSGTIWMFVTMMYWLYVKYSDAAHCLNHISCSLFTVYKRTQNGEVVSSVSPFACFFFETRRIFDDNSFWGSILKLLGVRNFAQYSSIVTRTWGLYQGETEFKINFSAIDNLKKIILIYDIVINTCNFYSENFNCSEYLWKTKKKIYDFA
jgi:transposase-like protein